MMYRSISFDSSLDCANLPDNCIGKIHLEVGYDSNKETLNVTIQKMKHLPENLTKNGVIVKYTRMKNDPIDHDCLFQAKADS